MLKIARHPLPRRQGRPRRQRRQFRRSARCRRSGRAGAMPMTRPAPTSCASSTSPRATRTAAILLDVVQRTAEACFMPLTVGGGVRRSTTSASCCSPAPTKSRSTPRPCTTASFVREAAEKFGSQCIVVAIDAKQTGPGRGRSSPMAGASRPASTRSTMRAKCVAPRRGRDPADLDGPRRHQSRLRYRADPRGRRRGRRAGDRLGRGRRRSIISSKASATATPAPCSPPRSSISANSRIAEAKHYMARARHRRCGSMACAVLCRGGLKGTNEQVHSRRSRRDHCRARLVERGNAPTQNRCSTAARRARPRKSARKRSKR